MGIHIIFLDLEFSFESSGLKLLLGTKHRNIYNISSVIKDKGGKNAWIIGIRVIVKQLYWKVAIEMLS